MAGQQSQKLLDKTTPWSETFYDKGPEYVEEMLKNRGEDSNQIVYIEYQYYQIGLTEEWFKDLAQATSDRLTTRREILLQRLHGSSLSPWPQEDIEAIVSAQSKPIKELWLLDYYKFDVYEELDKNIPYIVGVDCATGTNQDNNAITILNPYTVKPAAEFECSFIGETKYEQLLIELCHVLPRAVLCIERNSIGDGIIDHLLYSVVSTRLYFDKAKNLVDSKTTADGTIESVLKKEANKKSYYGVYTSTSSREDMFSILSDRVATHKEDFVTANITRDISRLVMTKSGKIVAGEDFHDDSVMSYLIAMYVYTHGNNLEVFGIRKGLPTDYIPNQGMKRPEEIDPTLVDPKLIRQAIVQREKEKRMDEWDRMMKNAILNSQKESMQLAKAGLAVTDYTTTPDIPVYDFDDGSTDMDFFDELNSMGRFENFSNNNNGNPRGFRF